MALQADVLTQVLLKHYQRDFPIISRPFQKMAESLSKFESTNSDSSIYLEDAILKKLIELKASDVLTRIGPIFDHKRAGASLLAAVSVPPEKLSEVAAQINSFAEVNHNYGREHHYNLWFVVTAPDKSHLEKTLTAMEKATGFSILRLPMKKSYYIDLGFQVSHDKFLGTRRLVVPQVSDKDDSDSLDLLCETDQHRLRVLIQDGLPLVSQPFQELANYLGFATEKQVMNTLKSWLKTGLIKRIGLVTNHHQLGYTSNAMVVWDVPDHLIDEAGELIKESGLVSLCYQRERSLPEWSYNLYCMIHSRDRENVLAQYSKLNKLAGLSAMSSEILFTIKQYKQKGGLYCVDLKTNSEAKLKQYAHSNEAIKQAGMM